MTTREEMEEMIYPRQHSRLRIENSSRTLLVLTTFLIIANILLVGHSVYSSFFEQPCNIFPLRNINNTEASYNIFPFRNKNKTNASDPTEFG